MKLNMFLALGNVKYYRFKILILIIIFAFFYQSCTESRENKRVIYTQNNYFVHNEGNYTVFDPFGIFMYGIKIQDDDIEIKTQDLNLTSEYSKFYRKYFDENMSVVALVEHKTKSFRITKPGGMLIWSVKVNKDLIEIYDNPSRINPYYIKKEDIDKWRMYRQNVILSELIFEDDLNRIKGSNAFKIRSWRLHPAFIVLNMEYPDPEKIILVAELLAIGA